MIKPWEVQDQELLRKEMAYLQRYTWFEKIVDNDWQYVLSLALVMMLAFNIGFGIGLLL